MALIPTPEETRAQNTAQQSNPIPLSGGYIPTPAYSAPSSIGSAQLTPQAPIVLPPPQQPPNPQTTNVSIPTPQQIVNVPTTDAEMKQNDYLKQIADITGNKSSLATFQTNQEKNAGVPDLTKNLNDLASQIEGLNNQATALQNEAAYTIPNQAQESASGRGMTTGGLAPLTASQLRQNQIKQGAIASQALTLKSAYYAANGQYLLAKDAADKAAQVQFDAQQNTLDTLKAQLDALAPTLNKEEKKQAAIQAIQLQDRQAQITNAREDFKSAQALAIATIKNFPNDTQAQLAAQAVMKLDPNSPTYLTDALNLVGKYQQDPIALQNDLLDQQYKRAQIRKLGIETKALQNNGTGNALPADYESFTASLTPEQSVAFKAIPENDKASIAQLINGDALISDLVKSRGLQGTQAIQNLINEARSVDPNFSVNNNKVRYTFMQNWNNPNGKSSTTRNALNTALGHLADFKSNADALDPGSIKKLNSVANILSTETGDPKVLRLRTDINALATEVATAYKGGLPSEAEIRNWEETIAADFSKKQFSGVTDELARLLSSKVTASRYQYKTTMGYDYAQPIIDPEKKQALLDAGVDPSVFPTENTKTQDSAIPQGAIKITRNGQEGYITNMSEFDPKTDKKI